MSIVIFILIICAGVSTTIVTKKLTVAAALTGGLVATAIFAGVSWGGVILLAAFFILSTIATSWQRNTKAKVGMAQEGGGRRTTGQVLANGGAAALLGLIAVFIPQHAGVCMAMVAAAFSSATADTLSSELGTVYGKKYYDILSFKKGNRGADGVVSVEGFLIGCAGSATIALIYAAFNGWNLIVTWVVVAGTIGNIADSVLGATMERRGLFNNNAVNFLNTVIAALVMLLLWL